GLPESACVSVTAVQQGKVVVRHLRQPFISELDGYGINPVPAPENSIGRVYESPGGQLWTVVPGGLQEYKNDAWVFHPVPEIAQRPPPSRFATRSALPLYPTRQGRVLFLLPESLMEFNSENPEHPVTEILRTANQT